MPFAKILNLPVKKIFNYCRRGGNLGFCPICEKRTLFLKIGDWLRDHYLCVRCRSIPRQRALIFALESYVPNWRDLSIHESSPSKGGIYNKFLTECRDYTPSQFFPNQPRGIRFNDFRNEDLANQTFADESFDIVITQDVLEHLLEPVKSLQEIYRTLKPGGVHVFSVPWHFGQQTRIRAKLGKAGIEHIQPPDYHGNPIDEKGALVVTEWGDDLIDTIYEACGMTTTVIRAYDKRYGIDGKFNEIFISRKNTGTPNTLLTSWQGDT